MNIVRQLIPRTPAKVHLIFRIIGIVVLVSGMSLAGILWHAQDELDRQARARQTNELGSQFTEALPPDDSKRYAYDVEKYYGKTGLLMDQATRALRSLGHGKGLAGTIAVVSILIVAGCFLISVAYHPQSHGEQNGGNK